MPIANDVGQHTSGVGLRVRDESTTVDRFQRNPLNVRPFHVPKQVVCISASSLSCHPTTTTLSQTVILQMPPKVTTSSHIRVTRSRTYTALASSNTLASPIQDAIQDDPPPNTPRKKARPNPAAKTEFENAPARSISRTPVPPFSLPAAIAHLTGVDARFGPIFKTIPPKPFVDGGATQDDIDPFRTLVTSIIGQQVSWMAARSITKRFVELFCGEVSGERYGDGPFPTRHQVAASRVEALKGVGCSTRKAEYCESSNIVGAQVLTPK